MFKVRSGQLELLDGDNIPSGDLFQNLRELDFINHWLGGYKISYGALARVLEKDRTYHLVDIGSGGGDTLKRIFRWNESRRYPLVLYGVDIKPICIEYAESHQPNKNIRFICDDYRNIDQHIPRLDIIHASLFCHHLSDDALVELIRFSLQRKAVLIINDLERNALAYYLIKLLTRLFSKSYLVKNDAPLSVSRGFRKNEWLELIRRAGAVKYSVKNKWAFRHEVVVYP
jgi:2-polyprenyl-3-methyl-5-hydroxy-6-metoxy-1,4-benzoquinol methylase